jgi:hypothetical protein
MNITYKSLDITYEVKSKTNWICKLNNTANESDLLELQKEPSLLESSLKFMPNPHRTAKNIVDALSGIDISNQL